MMRHGLAEARWKKSSYSGTADTDNCVEWQRLADGTVAVRDSKSPRAGAFVFPAEAWTAFVDGAKAGEFAP
jgi:hypothetical protein